MANRLVNIIICNLLVMLRFSSRGASSSSARPWTLFERAIASVDKLAPPANLVRLPEKGGDPAEWPEDLRVREFA